MKVVNKLKRGFTLIELMIVVAIIGILAVLAIYGVSKYLANAKTAEAKQSLGRMGKDAIAAYEKEGMSGTVLTQGTSTAILRALCLSASKSVPAAAAAIQGKKYQSAPSEWAVDVGTAVVAPKGFACLKFSLDQPQYFMYSYTSPSTASMIAKANGDLNGNGTLSTFLLNGSVVNGALNLAPNLQETQAEE